jgi:DNA-binding NarL/FixJ family response regulator
MSADQLSLQRILIASSHPLFGEGLRSLIEKYSSEKLQILGLVSNTKEALKALASLKPDLLIIDYDDDHLNRNEFLQQFIMGSAEIRVVLLSLKEGREGSDAIVYDRRTMSAEKIEDWLKLDLTESELDKGVLE